MMAEDYEMRIATWNVESLRKLTPEREEAFHKAMAKVDADVWVLTETWKTFSPGAAYQLAAESSLGEDLKAKKSWADRRWVTIWVKSSLHAKCQEVRSQPDRMACIQIKMPGYRDILVIGTVLPWNSDSLWLGAKGFCTALDSQAQEWRAKVNKHDDSTFILAGDFNQSLPYERWYGSKIGASTFGSTLQELKFICLTQGKCPKTSKPRIDHICVGGMGFDPKRLPRVSDWVATAVNGKPATDHSGIYVELELQSSK